MPRIATIPAGHDAIGGYPSLEAPGIGEDVYPGAHAFQSARAAFMALLQAVKPQAVWLPWYLCDSMTEPLEQTGVPVHRYRLAPDFSMAGHVALQPGQLLLHVNHFGLLDRQQDQLVSQYPASQLVFDKSQALYSRPHPVLANIYSPRKFVGVADGGLLVAPSLELPHYAQDEGSGTRGQYLFQRQAFGAEAGYAQYLAAEASLSNLPPLRMSEVTARKFAAAPHDVIRNRRRSNFLLLDKELGASNHLRWALGPDMVPLCYPFLPAHKNIREALIAARIYCPRYWPELLDATRSTPERERKWAADLIALPLDQRLSAIDLLQYVTGPLRQLLAM